MKKNSNKGITLIALVVTIVILIILSLITVNVVFGDNGIIKQVDRAKEENIIGQEKEQISIAYVDCQSDNYIYYPDFLEVEDYQLEEKLRENGNKVIVTQEGNDLKVLYIETEHTYTIKENGEIIKDKVLTPNENMQIVDVEGYRGDSILAITSAGEVLYQKSVEFDKLITFDKLKSTVITENGIKQKVRDCFIDNKGNLYEWNKELDKPVNILKGKNIIKIYTTSTITAVIDTEGKVYIWGRYEYSLGNGVTTDSSHPICISDIKNNVLNGKNIQEILIGNTMMLLDKDGKVYAWGYNKWGNIGDGTNINSNLPICISDIANSPLKGKKIVKLEDGGWYNYYIAIDSDGKIYTWGKNEYGTLGNATTTNSNLPICISDIEGNALKNKKIIAIDSTGTDIIVRDINGKVYAWGRNEYGILGNGTTNNSSVPICISDITTSSLYNKKIVKMNNYYLPIATDSEGKLHTWGKSIYSDSVIIEVDTNIPICINDMPSSALKDKKITEIYTQTGIVKDDTGKIYTARNNSNIFRCFNDEIGSPIYNKTISRIIEGSEFIDNEGNLYVWLENENKVISKTADNIAGNLLYNKRVKNMKTNGQSHVSVYYDIYIYITENGEVIYQCNEEYG